MKIRMMNYLLMFLISMRCFGQQANPADMMPKVYPLSPQAGSLGQYGELPVDLSTGKINHTIPLYTIKEGDFEYPIQLMYNYGGLKVDDIPSDVGYGWAINSSGYISIQIRGGSDFGAGGYLLSNTGKNLIKPFLNSEWDLLEPNIKNAKILNLFQGINRNEYDGEPDKYVFNVGSKQFVFFLDENGKAVFPVKNNSIIDFDRTIEPNFKVVDERGVKYNFQKREWTEVDATLSNNMTALNLTSIEFPNNKKIQFNYLPAAYSSNSYSESYLEIPPLKQNFMDCNCPTLSDVIPNSVHYVHHVNKISEISFSQGKAVFTYEFDRLTILSIYDNNGNIIEKFNLIYDTNNKLLVKVDKVNSKNISQPFYQFEYYDSIPDRISKKSQDPWGFYNLKKGLTDTYRTYIFKGDISVDFEATRRGALKKIFYPTKGFTEISYEQNTSKDIKNGIYSDLSMGFANKAALFINGVETPDVAIEKEKKIFIPFEQIVKIDLYAYAGSDKKNTYIEASSNIEFYPKISDLDKVLFSGGQNNNPGMISFSSKLPNTVAKASVRSYYVKYGPGEITIKSRIYGESPIYDYMRDIRTTVAISYNDTKPSQYTVGGIRVSKTIDFDKTNTIESRYLYEDEEGKTSGRLLYESFNSYEKACTQNSSSQSGYCNIPLYYYKVLASSSLVPLNSYNNSPVIYSKVKKIMGNGTSFYKYSNHNLSIVNSIPLIPCDFNDYKNGKVLGESIYDKSNNLLKEEINNYESIAFNSNKAVGLSLFRKIDRYTNFASSTGTGGDIEGAVLSNVDDFVSKGYSYSERDYNLSHSTTTLYPSSTGIIKNINEYEYNNINQLSSKATTNSKGENIITKYFYAHEEGNQAMIDANMIGIPLKTETFTNGVLTESQKTAYNKTVATNNLILPTAVLNRKGVSGSEQRMTYDLYDPKGNIRQYTPDGGVATVVIWGYNQTLPIAKIENASYSEIQQYEGNLQTLSNATDEGALLLALADLRHKLPNAMVTTYTYKPLIGVSTITDPKGQTTTYSYDAFNRLKEVKDYQGNVLSKNEYHYKN